MAAAAEEVEVDPHLGAPDHRTATPEVQAITMARTIMDRAQS